MIFLDELDGILNILQVEHTRALGPAIGHRLARCLENVCSQVVEKTFRLWNNVSFCAFFVKDKQNLRVLAPIIYGSLRKCSENQENQSIRQMALHVIGMMADVDRNLIANLASEYVDDTV